jgi:hypothetical protein
VRRLRVAWVACLAVVCAVEASRADCVPSDRAVCLDGGRFRVTAFSRNAAQVEKPANGVALPAVPPEAPRRIAEFSFADTRTVDIVVALEDRCAATGGISVALAATTFAAFRVEVEDLVRGTTRTLQRDAKPQRGTLRLDDAFECVAP